MATDTSHLSKVEQLRSELSSREHRIGERLSALQDEVASLAPPLPKDVLGHPLVKVGGMLLAGLAVGWLLGGRRTKRASSGVSASHRALVDQYVDALVAEVGERARPDEAPEDALRRVLGERVPLVVLTNEAMGRGQDSDSVVWKGVRLALHYVVPVVLRQGIDYLLPPVEGEAPAGAEGEEA